MKNDIFYLILIAVLFLASVAVIVALIYALLMSFAPGPCDPFDGVDTMKTNETIYCLVRVDNRLDWVDIRALAND